LELIRQFDIIGFSIGRLNSTDSVPLFVFLWGFGTIPTVWHYWFFAIGFWNCSIIVALFVFIWDFGTVLTVWNYLFFYWTLELFRQCGIIYFSIGLWNCSDSVALLVFHFFIGL
jgi:hypothetical protein